MVLGVWGFRGFRGLVVYGFRDLEFRVYAKQPMKPKLSVLLAGYAVPDSAQ